VRYTANFNQNSQFYNPTNNDGGERKRGGDVIGEDIRACAGKREPG
jgi:hypothetical protein